MPERPARRRRRNPLPVLVGLIVVPSVPLVAAVAWGQASGDRPTAAANVAVQPDRVVAATPVMSFRRAPDTLAARATLGALSDALSFFAPQLNDSSCLVVRAGGRNVSAVRPDEPVIPASNEKLLVGAVALELLGADFRFTTSVVGDVDGSGAVPGDLYLVGGGDPLLATDWYPDSLLGADYPQRPATRLEDLADAVVAAGVTSVAGNVVGDESRYDSEHVRDALSSDLYGSVVGPYGALVVNDARSTEGSSTVTDEPAVGAAELFADLLRERGVSIGGSATSGVAPVGVATIAAVESAPFAEVLAHTLQTSDNNSAEMLLKEIAVASGRRGTTADGVAVLSATVASWGLSTDGFAPVDGSGLDIANQTTCTLLAGVLDRAGVGSVLADALPILGVEGTLDDELVDHPMAGKVAAKTGSLGQDADVTDVKALSGVVPVEGAPGLVFSLVLNGDTVRDEATYRAIWSTFFDVLATYPTGPSADDLAPREAVSPG